MYSQLAGGEAVMRLAHHAHDPGSILSFKIIVFFFFPKPFLWIMQCVQIDTFDPPSTDTWLTSWSTLGQHLINISVESLSRVNLFSQTCHRVAIYIYVDVHSVNYRMTVSQVSFECRPVKHQSRCGLSVDQDVDWVRIIGWRRVQINTYSCNFGTHTCLFMCIFISCQV